MSEFRIEVVRIGPIEAHPNADRLEITQVYGGYPTIIKKGDFREGDLAVYVPLEAVLPDKPEYEFLGKDRLRLKAKRLRGVFSMGLLIPAPEGVVEGQDVQELLGITRYDEDSDEAKERRHLFKTTGENEAGPNGWDFVKYTDIEGWRRWKNVLQTGEEVVVTEKIHGQNYRVVHDGSRLWVGSRTCIKRPATDTTWWKLARDYNLEEKLASKPRHILFGEEYGQVQDLKYDIPVGKRVFAAFDVYSVDERRYLNADEAQVFARELDIPWVPILYRGPWDPTRVDEWAEGKSTIANNVREGFVVKPVVERWERSLGRVVLKMHGTGYLLRKGG